ncbi:MAG: family 78 glycoside hydrolase catalytic domain [Bacteroidota bacterium]|nr:family 78 glycoside hydrolase catalytic domain [Bacteroidota bacterium]
MNIWNDRRRKASAVLMLSCAVLFVYGSPVKLRCEQLTKPIGIDAPYPRLSWQSDDQTAGACQTAFRILIGTDSTLLSTGSANVWNSGKIISDSQLVLYKGPYLLPFTRYYWTVVQWDKNGKASEPAGITFFETGMMTSANWQGEWIFDGKSIEYKPAPYFRKTVTIAKPVKSVRAYVMVAGLYELYINGRKIGDRMLDPMYTRFDRRTLYATLDLTGYLNRGKNAIGLLLGNGWYNLQSKAVWSFDKAPWRQRPRCCMDIRVDYEDGSSEVISTDRSWKTHDSPLTFNSIYTGERYDACLELSGWCEANFNDSKWSNAELTGAPSKQIVSQQLCPIKVVEALHPVSVKQLDLNTYVYAFAKNIAGVSRLSIEGPAGTVIELKHGEKLYKNGHVNTESISEHARPEASDPDPFQTDCYTLKGAGIEIFSPRFNYKGFQYVEVKTSVPLKMDTDNLQALVMHSDVELAGAVKTSDELVNKIFVATNNSYLNNLFGYPTDCPHREKNGWTGDAQIAVETGLYSFDGITVYEKWLNDHLDEQLPNGVLPCIIPTAGWGYHWANGTDWVSSVAIIPWEVYQFYGDKSLLEKTYDGIKRYVDMLERKSKDGLINWGLGDWVPFREESNVELISSLYFYKDVFILSESAKLFGLTDDQQKYSVLANSIKEAINRKFLDQQTGVYAKGTQTEQSAALYFQVVPDQLKQKVVSRLVERIHQTHDHMDVGVLGAKTLFNALSENGQSNLAFKLLSQKTHPSFGYYVDNGATTLYEGWDKDKNAISSLNHIMYGECAAWLYKGISGIYPDPKAPGFKQVILRPSFVKGLDWAEGYHESPYGKIVSNWKRSGRVLLYHAEVPSNSTAILILQGIRADGIIESGKPIEKNRCICLKEEQRDRIVLELQSGRYDFRINKR